MATDSFCYRPWLHLQIKSSGAIKFCCDSEDTVYLQNQRPARAIEANLEEAMNAPLLKDVRRALLNGEQHPSCRKCWLVENAQGSSLRQKINRRWDSELSRSSFIDATHADGYLEDAKVYEIEFRLGNLCNLRCRMCNPLNSLKLTAEYIALKKSAMIREDKELIDLTNESIFSWHEEPEFVEWIKPYVAGMIDIQFAGGEPFLSPTHQVFLNLLIDSGHSRNMTLRYTTNGTVMVPEVFEMWKEFKKVTISVSVDDREKVYEYIRQDSKWETVLRNLHKFDSMIGSGVASVNIQPLPNVYNIFTLPTMPRWMLKNFKKIGWATHLNFQLYPSWQSAYILNEAEKRKCIDICNEEIRTITSDVEISQDPRTENILNWLNSLTGSLVEKDWTALRCEFKKNNDQMDTYRKSDGTFLAQEFDQLF